MTLVSSVPRNTPSVAPGTDVPHGSKPGAIFFFTFLIGARAVQIIYKSFLILCGPDSDDVTRLGLGYVEGNTLL
jgi:hypothetical protein